MELGEGAARLHDLELSDPEYEIDAGLRESIVPALPDVPSASLPAARHPNFQATAYKRVADQAASLIVARAVLKDAESLLDTICGMVDETRRVVVSVRAAIADIERCGR